MTIVVSDFSEVDFKDYPWLDILTKGEKQKNNLLYKHGNHFLVLTKTIEAAGSAADLPHTMREIHIQRALKHPIRKKQSLSPQMIKNNHIVLCDGQYRFTLTPIIARGDDEISVIINANTGLVAAHANKRPNILNKRADIDPAQTLIRTSWDEYHSDTLTIETDDEAYAARLKKYADAGYYQEAGIVPQDILTKINEKCTPLDHDGISYCKIDNINTFFLEEIQPHLARKIACAGSKADSEEVAMTEDHATVLASLGLGLFYNLTALHKNILIKDPTKASWAAGQQAQISGHLAQAGIASGGAGVTPDTEDDKIRVNLHKYDIHNQQYQGFAGANRVINDIRAGLTELINQLPTLYTDDEVLLIKRAFVGLSLITGRHPWIGSIPGGQWNGPDASKHFLDTWSDHSTAVPLVFDIIDDTGIQLVRNLKLWREALAKSNLTEEETSWITSLDFEKDTPDTVTHLEDQFDKAWDGMIEAYNRFEQESVAE